MVAPKNKAKAQKTKIDKANKNVLEEQKTQIYNDSKIKASTTKKEESFLKDKKKMTIVGAVALLLVIAGIAGFMLTQENETDKVEEAVKLNIEYYNTRNIDAYYDLVSQNSKDQYNIKLEDIANLLNKVQYDGRTITLVNISQITIQGDTAQVAGVVSIKDNQGTQTAQFAQTYRKENGAWKYEQKMTESTQTSSTAPQ